MRDFFMGAEVEVEELGLGDPAPEVTPPQGVIVSRLEADGWVRKYLYKSISGGRPSEIMVGEVPPDPALGESAPYVDSDAPVRLDGFALMRGGRPQMQAGPIPISAHMEGRLSLPGQTSVPLIQQTPFLGQTPTAPPAAPVQQTVSVPTGDAGLPPAEALPPPPPAPALPDCASPLQLPDGTVVNPDDPVTLKELCAMLPYIAKYVEQQAKVDEGPTGLMRPNGAIPLSRSNYGSVPSFGPAGGPFAQGGGGGGGGGGGPAGFGPVGVINPATPVGGPGQGNTGPQGPPGPPGVGNVIDGIAKTDGDFLNTGAMAIIPGTSKVITVGGPVLGDGTTPVAISFSMELDAGIVPAQIFDVFAGIDIDGTQYQLWRQGEQQGAGSDKVFRLSASGTLYVTLTPGPHTISICYGDNAGENPFTVTTAPGQPACWTAQHA